MLVKKFIYLIDHKINLITILFLFWALFWGLNGFDKFFNGTSEPNLDPNAATEALIDNKTGEVVFTVQPSQKIGWYGVNRDDKFANYFDRLGLPQIVATASLYFFALLEIILAFLFFWLFLKQFSNDEPEDVRKVNFFTDRTVHRLIFKLSIWIFIAFLTGDILFGDRAEVWEHGTFLLMTLITYDMWYRTDQFFIDMMKREREGLNKDGFSVQASSY